MVRRGRVARACGAAEDPTVTVEELNTVAVIGAGTMGGGIAMSFADFGTPVKIMDATREVLEKGLQRVRDNYAISVKRPPCSPSRTVRRPAKSIASSRQSRTT